MNLFTLARQQLEKEGEVEPKGINIIDKMIMIRKFMDRRPKLTKFIVENKAYKNAQQKYYYKNIFLNNK